LLAAALIAALALWAWNGSGGGVKDNTLVSANVEYTVRDAAGNVKDHGLFHNAVVDELRDDVITYLRAGATGKQYDTIAVCKTGTSSATTTGTACLSVDAAAVWTVTNPKVGSVGSLATVAGTSSSYTVTQTFTVATGTPAITEIQLAKNDDGLIDGTTPVATEIGAYRALTATLAAGDTITIVWTVKIGL
jgi:hypothetical protein